ncbi:unnamed protein product [Brassica rapa]|uniref:Uncharacterized protein n=2 Tax=Brassica TaxID=3705 RepID=A0A3P6BMV5_BRACM|nr:unnamed protein product [Brassica napus]CAG7904757.1 unnamed protein product [Brassica rapa]VDD02244.1 unnamed protein product [Brassica rapa]
MDRRGCGNGNIAKMCLCLSITLLLFSSSENSFVTPLPAEERYQAKGTGTPREGGLRRMMMGTPPDSSGWVDGSQSGRGSGP